MFLLKCREQPVKHGVGRCEQLVVVVDGRAQPCQHALHARRLGRRSAAHVEEMHQLAESGDGRRFQREAGGQDFKGHAAAQVAERCAIEVEPQGIGRTFVGGCKPEKASRRINETPDQPRAGEAIHPWPSASGPSPPLVIRLLQTDDLPRHCQRFVWR